jgi:hypothetical protein
METAPLGGKPVWLVGLVGDSLQVPIYQPAYHYTTRRRERSPMRWVEAAWWARANTAREPVGFEPLGWTRFQ